MTATTIVIANMGRGGNIPIVGALLIQDIDQHIFCSTLFHLRLCLRPFRCILQEGSGEGGQEGSKIRIGVGHR